MVFLCLLLYPHCKWTGENGEWVWFCKTHFFTIKKQWKKPNVTTDIHFLQTRYYWIVLWKSFHNSYSWAKCSLEYMTIPPLRALVKGISWSYRQILLGERGRDKGINETLPHSISVSPNLEKVKPTASSIFFDWSSKAAASELGLVQMLPFLPQGQQFLESEVCSWMALLQRATGPEISCNLLAGNMGHQTNNIIIRVKLCPDNQRSPVLAICAGNVLIHTARWSWGGRKGRILATTYTPCGSETTLYHRKFSSGLGRDENLV